MTFATRLAGVRHRMSLVVLIQGVERVFKESSTLSYAGAYGGSRPESACLERDSVEIGRQELDIISRSVTGGGLTFTLVEPHGSTILRDIFQARARRATYVRTDATKTDVTIDVGSTSGLTSPVYIGGETITFSGTSGGNQLTGCTRGCYGSKAQAHLTATSAESASGVYSAPPSWVGRRVYLKAVFLDESGSGGTSTSNYEDLGTFVIDEPPQVENLKKWKISCSPLSDEHAKRKAYVGIKEAEPTADPPLAVAGSGAIDIYVDSAAQFRGSAASVYEHAAITMDGAGTSWNMIAKLAGASTLADPDYIEVVPEPGMTNTPVTIEGDGVMDGIGVSSVRRIFFATTRARKAMMYLLTSNTGNGDNGSYDVLYGQERDDGVGPAFRMGCGIDSTDISSSSFFLVAPGMRWSYCLDETTEAGDILREFCWMTDSFWTVESGLLKVKKLRDVATASSLTIGRGVYEPGSVSVSYSEALVWPTVKLRMNYSPFSKDYDATLDFVDHELTERFPGNSNALELDFKGVAVSQLPYQRSAVQSLRRPTAMPFADIEALARGWQRNFARGLVVVELQAKITAATVNVGDVVTLDIADAYDFDGGTLEGVTARVTAKQIDVGTGRVVLRMFVMEKVHLVTPGDEITAVSTTTSANDTITIAGGSTTNYAVGMSCRIWDGSAGTSQTATIASLPSATSIKFTASLSPVPTANEDFVTWNTNGTNVSAAPASGYSETDYSYQMPNPATAAAGIVRRYR